ncbi:uncharacterized protein LOC131220274 [Magnolia sinica]|uniref:uncharacterized protein LOC131220274 n=1 Tax=Magnolia sinica TaxID=86752 RepID=UPI002657C046|nr:uncharacterized protein LOC131220274 [Magnolia sinica]
MTCTRSDIAYAVGVVSRYLDNLGKEHWAAVKWILRLLRGSFRGSDFLTKQATEGRSIVNDRGQVPNEVSAAAGEVPEAGAAIPAVALGAITEADMVPSAVDAVVTIAGVDAVPLAAAAANGDTYARDVLFYRIQSRYLGTVSKVVLGVPLVLRMLGECASLL